WDPDFP
ncbi:hypothetical protein N499_0875B, partial [Wolbachia pipientis wVitA]